MQYYSTNLRSPSVSLRDAVLQGIPKDQGLYMPEEIPRLPHQFLTALPELDFRQIAMEISLSFFGDDLPESIIESLVSKAFTFDVPLVRLNADVQVLELFHGPTLAFKDFAARFMARLMGYYVQEMDRELNILVATSGDTGSAVARGFYKVPGIRVFILYPSGKVSPIQEQQLTTLGENITALEVDGTFDDCQRLVKSAFLDPDLSDMLRLTSANSINVGRLIPQSFYYFYAWGQAQNRDRPVVFSVPSGNFGNLTAGLLAKRMGLPVARFVAATNINDVVPRFLESGTYQPHPTHQTISNAMDVGNPSNFARMMALYDNSAEKLRQDVCGFRFTDQQAKAAMEAVNHRYGYVLDPHCAVGYLGLRQYQQESEAAVAGIVLGTAHPAKFASIVEAAIDGRISIPHSLQEAMQRPKAAFRLANDFEQLKQFLASGNDRGPTGA